MMWHIYLKSIVYLEMCTGRCVFHGRHIKTKCLLIVRITFTFVTSNYNDLLRGVSIQLYMTNQWFLQRYYFPQTNKTDCQCTFVETKTQNPYNVVWCEISRRKLKSCEYFWRSLSLARFKRFNTDFVYLPNLKMIMFLT